MPAILHSLVLATVVLLGTSVFVEAARADETNLIDPGKVFLDDAEMPRGYKRLTSEDQWTANPGLITAIRQYSDDSALIQQIVYSASSTDKAGEVGGVFLDTLPAKFEYLDYNEILTLGDRAVSGYGENENGVAIHVVAFQRSTLVGIITWIDAEGADLEADTTALATRMEARARAALPPP
jgi:hypothetical protein